MSTWSPWEVAVQGFFEPGAIFWERVIAQEKVTRKFWKFLVSSGD